MPLLQLLVRQSARREAESRSHYELLAQVRGCWAVRTSMEICMSFKPLQLHCEYASCAVCRTARLRLPQR